jgi:hypothetical protein
MDHMWAAMREQSDRESFVQMNTAGRGRLKEGKIKIPIQATSLTWTPSNVAIVV